MISVPERRISSLCKSAPQRRLQLSAPQRRSLPVGSGIAFRETEEKNSTGGFVKQSVDKLISSIDDIDHEFLHLFVL